MTYLGEGGRIDLVFAGNLQADGGRALDIVRSLDTGLDEWVDLVVVGCGEDAQVVGGGDGTAVLQGGVSESGRVLCQCGLLDIIASLTTNDETLMSEDTIDGGIDVTVGWVVVEETAGVEGTLLEVEGELLLLETETLLGGSETCELGLDAAGDYVVELYFCVENGVGSPRFGDGDTYSRGFMR